MLNLKSLLFKPKTAFSIFIIFIFIYLYILGKEGAFSKGFLNFGPSEDTKFLTLKLDTWTKVLTVYGIGFFSSFITTYYKNITHDQVHSLLWNPVFKKKLSVSKSLMNAIIIGEPFLFGILDILNFFIDLTLELQFILPKFIGSIIIEIPYGLYKANQKKYKSKN